VRLASEEALDDPVVLSNLAHVVECPDEGKALARIGFRLLANYGVRVERSGRLSWKTY
jgi:hypothetical protein